MFSLFPSPDGFHSESSSLRRTFRICFWILGSCLTLTSVSSSCQVGIRAAPPEDHAAASCSISVSDAVSSLDSVSVSVSTSGLNCSFNLTDSRGDGAECVRIQGEEEERRNRTDGSSRTAFLCVLDHLEPGTSHLLQVRSQTDGESANVTVNTRKCWSSCFQRTRLFTCFGSFTLYVQNIPEFSSGSQIHSHFPDFYSKIRFS